ncbi:MAG: DNA polymerase III subunit alpha [Nocardioides sp.]
MTFVHLHVHTEYSRLDGLTTLTDLVDSAVADGQPAAAITDHGSLAGAFKFDRACRAVGIKPILGCEIYLALIPEGADPFDPDARFAKTTCERIDVVTGQVKTTKNSHLTVLVRNETGWRNLCAMLAAAEDSFFGKPLVDYALLRKHGEGLIVLTGCLGGPVASRVAVGDVAGAQAAVETLVECVGREHVFVEIMEHGLAAERENLPKMAALADVTGTRLVATNDSHHTRPEDAAAHDAWLANGTQRTLSDPNRFSFNGTGYHLRTEQEMRDLHAGKRWQEAVSNTVVVADLVEGSVLPLKPLRLPKFPLPEGQESAAGYLKDLVLAGAKERYGLPFSPDAQARLRFEFDTITSMGLEDYFLIIHDVLAWARSDRGLPTSEHPEGIPGAKKPIKVGPGRGSAAGSAVAYSLHIHQLEPLANGLLFERFLDVERAGMPDIDVDFESARQSEVFEYVAAKYGTDYVARIGTFQGSKSKRAIKDAARVLGLTPVGLTLVAKIPSKGAVPLPFCELFNPRNAAAAEFRSLVENSFEAQRIVELARSFEGIVAGEGIHPAGIVISDEPLTDLLPTRKQRDKNGATSAVSVALWDGGDIDKFGMLKLDALAITNLDYVAVAEGYIEQTTGEIVRMESLPDPDTAGDPRVAAAFALLRQGRTPGLFQLASPGMTQLCEQVAPTQFSDLSALVALYRPGPMGANMHTRYVERKAGREEVDYGMYTSVPAEQEVIAGILDDTYGIICYQESLMQLADRVAGFEPAQKDRLRKAFSKKIQAEMDALKPVFIRQGESPTRPDGTPKVPFRTATLETLWRTFDASSQYLFNRSHSAAYGHLAYTTAYFKANWPLAYGAAILAVSQKDEYRRLMAIRDLRNEGIEVLAPDVNLSGSATAPEPGSSSEIRIGLSEIRDVASNGDKVLIERHLNGPFVSFIDAVTRLKGIGVPITAVEALIESGAFDRFDLPRLAMMQQVRAGAPSVTDPREWSPLELSIRQRHRLGVSVGEHPMKTFGPVLAGYDFARHVDYRSGHVFEGSPVGLHRATEGSHLVAGVVTAWENRKTRRGARMANFTLEGRQVTVDGVAFEHALSGMPRLPERGDIVVAAVVATSKTIEHSDADLDDPEAVMVEPRVVTELTASRIEVVPIKMKWSRAGDVVEAPDLAGAVLAGRGAGALRPDTVVA